MSSSTSVTIRSGEIVYLPPPQTSGKQRFMTVHDLPRTTNEIYASTYLPMQRLAEEMESHNHALEENLAMASELIRLKHELEEAKAFGASISERYEVLLKEKADRLETEAIEAKESSGPIGWIKKKLHNL